MQIDVFTQTQIALCFTFKENLFPLVEIYTDFKLTQCEEEGWKLESFKELYLMMEQIQWWKLGIYGFSEFQKVSSFIQNEEKTHMETKKYLLEI